MARAAFLACLTVAVALGSSAHGQEDGPSPAAAARRGDIRLVPTAHPPLPASLASYWLVPEGFSAGSSAAARGETVAERFARGARLIAAGDHAAGLPLVADADLSDTRLGVYPRFYAGVALIGLGRLAEADAALTKALAANPSGYLREAVRVRLAEVALARGEPARAVELLEDLVDERVVAREALLLSLATAAERAGDVDRALAHYRTIYYEHPLSTEAVDAQQGIARLETPSRILPDRYRRELARANALYAARRWAQARAAFEPLVKVAPREDRALIDLRLGAIEYYLSRHTAARNRLSPLLDHGDHGPEARYFHLSATRSLGQSAAYVRLVRQLVEDHPENRWTEEALNDLASHFIRRDEDEEADRVFRQILQHFPKGKYGDRAAWQVGWRAYRSGRFREAAETFEWGAAAYPRADYRPAWLYWSGRARAHLGEHDVAASRLALTIADYRNSYYGRLAEKALQSLPDVPQRAVLERRPVAPASSEPVPTDGLIRDLIALKLYDDALREVNYAQRRWADSPQLQATTAFVRYMQGLNLKAQERFAALRGAINTMRRAYPQFMAAGGEDMPPEVLGIIFPLDYWPLITKYSGQHDLDPYLIAALMAQESTFTAEIRSSANAYGLMQIIPSTGRRYATRLGIRNFTTRSLTNPETNVRLGTQYFKDLLVRYNGAVHLALAGYNAGENRVDRWLAERPPLPPDEFIDDIPFQETKTYVKRILGTVEDYRRLYGGGLLDPGQPMAVALARHASATRGGSASN